MYDQKLKIAILAFKSRLLPPWDYRSVETGLSGSEEAVVYVSQELERRGHSVTVFANPPEGSRWLPESAWEEDTEPFDLALLWRRTDAATGRKRAKVVFFWPHDSGYSNLDLSAFDGILLLSEYHRRLLKVGVQPHVLSGNGILLEHFEETPEKKNPWSVGYFSNYSRGLSVLISF